MPEAMDWARLAAYIDGEGYIRVALNSRNHQGRLEVNVSNTDYRLLVWLKDTFGGSVHRGGKSLAGKKQLWRWVLDRHRAAELLAQCLPYFIVKKEQAEIGIAFQSLIALQKANGEPWRGHKISAEAAYARAQFPQMMKEARSIGTERLVQ